MESKRDLAVYLIYPRLERGSSPPQFRFAPLSVLNLAGCLEADGIQAKILDCRIEEDYEAYLRKIEAPPVCFGISCILSYQIEDGLRLASFIRRRFPATPIVWGGWVPTTLPAETIANPLVDIVVRGQGEVTIVELIAALSKGHPPLAKIQGISYKANGEIFHNPGRPLADPNEFPPVPYRLLDVSKYPFFGGTLNYTSSFGCPHRCQFCGIQGVYGRKWFGLSAQRVLNDLDHLVHQYQLRQVEFFDDNFFVDLKRAECIMEGLAERGGRVGWNANGRIDQFLRFQPKFLELMKRSGCKAITVGAESGGQKLLDSLNKDLKVEDFVAVVRLLQGHGIALRMNFMYGLPGETPADLKETLRLIRGLKEIDDQLKFTLCFYVPIPGTDLFQKDLESGVVSRPRSLRDWGRYIQTDVTRPWFFKSDPKILKDDRKIFRIMTFYFWLGHLFGPFFPGPPLFKRLYGPLRRISNWRFERDLYAFPLEWWSFKALYALKKGLLRRWSGHGQASLLPSSEGVHGGE